MKNIKWERIIGFALLAESVIFSIGTRTFFSPCKEPKEDGSWMSCHWAGNAVFVLSLCLLAMSVVFLLVKSAEMKRGVAAGMIPVALAAAVLPGNAIALCMMKTMRCHTMLAPGAMVFGGLIALTAGGAMVVLGIRRKD